MKRLKKKRNKKTVHERWLLETEKQFYNDKSFHKKNFMRKRTGNRMF